MKSKSLLSMTLSVLLIASLTGCSSSSSETAPAESAAASVAEAAAEESAEEVISEAVPAEEAVSEASVSEAASVAESAEEVVSEPASAVESAEEVVSEAASMAESAEEAASEAASVEEAAEAVVSEASSSEESAEAPVDEADKAAADQVAALIDGIYVQNWTEETEAQCAEAKAAWDALTDAQKELVEGENADPDYFGRDTGDASADNPRNGDEIGENELLVVSFGTSFNGSRAEDIGGIEAALEAAYPDWSVRRAFTAQIIMNHVLARDGEKIDNMDQALQRAVDNGVKNLVVQPTHLMHGAEYDELVGVLTGYGDKFESVKVAEPLLGEVGADASVINADKETVAKAVTAEAVKESGYDSLEAAAGDGVAYVLMGHGTSHTANVTYSQMQTQMEQLGYANVFIGTVEGEPEDTACDVVIGKVKEAGYKKVILRPLMVVAGDHANNDMADPEDEESWISQFTADGSFESVDTQIAGLGRIPAIQELYVAHTADAIGSAGSEEPGAEEAAAAAAAGEEAPVDEADKAAADQVAALIDGIYVQNWTEETEAQCAEAKAAWDALTDAQKELVEGENADPDYFGRDTGDASADNPRNGDEIGENELLVVSFGTSFNGSRAEDIGGIEAALEAAYPDWSVRRAFTAQIIMNHILARDGEKIDNMDQALQRAVDNGVKNLVVQPTHLMHGAEYDELVGALTAYADKFESVQVAEPLLGEVGDDASVINADKEAVAKAITAEAVKESGYDSAEAAAGDGVAYVFMGHGTSHTANVTYDQMQTQMDQLGYANVFIGTVEGEPEDTACDVVIGKVKEAGYKKVILRPLMVVAGDHANNDMADPEDEESWISRFTADGSFESVDTQIAGLGRIPAIQELYIAHTAEAIGAETAGEDGETAAADGGEAAPALEDGVYTAVFTTDNSMFHVNEADEGKGVLTVEDGVMTIHIRLASKNIVNLFPGLAEDAQKEGAELLQPAAEEVTYSDGTTEEVFAFDVPVPAIGEEFDLALIGTKGKWYDHKVSVSDPIPQ